MSAMHAHCHCIFESAAPACENGHTSTSGSGLRSANSRLTFSTFDSSSSSYCVTSTWGTYAIVLTPALACGDCTLRNELIRPLWQCSRFQQRCSLAPRVTARDDAAKTRPACAAPGIMQTAQIHPNQHVISQFMRNGAVYKEYQFKQRQQPAP